MLMNYMSDIKKPDNWEDAKSELLVSISKTLDPKHKDNWAEVIEHVKKRLLENNAKKLKIYIYTQMFGGYVTGIYVLSLFIVGIFNMVLVYNLGWSR